jgi:hypothetical protein
MPWPERVLPALGKGANTSEVDFSWSPQQAPALSSGHQVVVTFQYMPGPSYKVADFILLYGVLLGDDMVLILELKSH